MSRFSVCTVGADRVALRRLTRFLDVCGYDVQACGDFERARERVTAAAPQLLAVFAAPQDAGAQALIRELRQQDAAEYTYALLLCENPGPADVLDALQDGWDDLIVAPPAHGELLARLRAGIRVVEFERRRRQQRQVDLRSPLLDRMTWLARLAPRLAPDGRGALAPGVMALFETEPPAPDPLATDGEPRGAAALAELAQRLMSSLPGLETPAQWSERTLAVLLPFADEESARQWAEEQLPATERATASRTTDQPVSLAAPAALSIGLCEVGGQQPLDRLIERAEGALRTARESGGNLVVTAAEFDAEQAAWAELAGDGRLFVSTTAGDVMVPCPLLLSGEESPEQALRVLRQTQLAAAPVVDRQGHYLGVITAESLARGEVVAPRARQSGSLRLLRHLVTQPPKFDERTGLSRLVEFFSGDPTPFAVVVTGRRPIGLVYCSALAGLNSAPAEREFAAVDAPSANSRYLVVAEAE